MERTAIYSFAGCVMKGAEYLTAFVPSGLTAAQGMSSDGILRLLDGECLGIEQDQLNRLRAKNPDLPAEFGRFDPLDVQAIRGFLWTPISDTIFLYPLARCPDKSLYPVHDAHINAVLGSTHASQSNSTIVRAWDALGHRLEAVPLKIIVHYPTIWLDNSPWKCRIDHYQELTRRLFPEWHHLRVDAELELPNGYWAHYSAAAKQRLWQQIEALL